MHPWPGQLWISSGLHLHRCVSLLILPFLLTFFSSVLALNTRSLTFLVANFTRICLGLPVADFPTRWDTAISLGSTWGSTFISLQIFRTASSVLSCSGFSGIPDIVKLSRRPCCSKSSNIICWSRIMFAESVDQNKSLFLLYGRYHGCKWLCELIPVGPHLTSLMINIVNRSRDCFRCSWGQVVCLCKGHWCLQNHRTEQLRKGHELMIRTLKNKLPVALSKVPCPCHLQNPVLCRIVDPVCV